MMIQQRVVMSPLPLLPTTTIQHHYLQAPYTCTIYTHLKYWERMFTSPQSRVWHLILQGNLLPVVEMTRQYVYGEHPMIGDWKPESMLVVECSNQRNARRVVAVVI